MPVREVPSATSNEANLPVFFASCANHGTDGVNSSCGLEQIYAALGDQWRAFTYKRVAGDMARYAEGGSTVNPLFFHRPVLLLG